MRSIRCRWRDLMRWLAWRRIRGAMRCRFHAGGAFLLALLMTTSAIVTGFEVGDFAHSQELKAQLAKEIDSFPDEWARSIEEREYQHSLFPDEGITPYRAELERELLKDYRPKAEAIARQIREMNDQEFYKQIKSKSLQTVLAIVGGAAVGKVGAKFGHAPKVIDRMRDFAKQFSDWHFNVWTINDLRGKNDLQGTLENRRNLLLQEMEWQMDRELQNWSTAEPLLQARLATHIRFLKNQQGDLSDEEYTQLVRDRAISIDTSSRLTRAAGSEDSPWTDFEELAQWLAEQVGRPLKETSAKGYGSATVTFEDYTLHDHIADINTFKYTLRYQGGAIGVTFDEEEYWWDSDRGSDHWNRNQLYPPVHIEAGEDRVDERSVLIYDDAGLYTQRTVWYGKDDNGHPVEVEFTIQILSIEPDSWPTKEPILPSP